MVFQAVLLGGLMGYARWQHLRRQAVAMAGAWAVAIMVLAVAYYLDARRYYRQEHRAATISLVQLPSYA